MFLAQPRFVIGMSFEGREFFNSMRKVRAFRKMLRRMCVVRGSTLLQRETDHDPQHQRCSQGVPVGQGFRSRDKILAITAARFVPPLVRRRPACAPAVPARRSPLAAGAPDRPRPTPAPERESGNRTGRSNWRLSFPGPCLRRSRPDVAFPAAGYGAGNGAALRIQVSRQRPGMAPVDERARPFDRRQALLDLRCDRGRTFAPGQFEAEAPLRHCVAGADLDQQFRKPPGAQRLQVPRIQGLS